MGLTSKPLNKVRPDVPSVTEAGLPRVGMKAGRKKVLPPKAPNETVQITLKVTQADLDKIDEAAAEQRLARAAFIRQAIFKQIDS